MILLVVAPVLSWSVYAIVKSFNLVSRLDDKFDLIHSWQLGYVFAAWYIVFLTRTYMAVNANGARAPARLDRPDQHVYTTLPGGARVLMASAGDAGRFNRAQRAAANMDESLPGFLTGALLVASVFGPVSLLLCVLNGFGRVRFANLYKQSCEARGAGFMFCVLAEQVSAGLVGVCAIKGILGPSVPF